MQACYNFDMTQGIALPPGVALGIIAFLLSLLPAGFFIWFLYLRRRSRSIRAGAVALAFAAGLALVIPSFQLEDMAQKAWLAVSPQTAHYFAGAVLPLQSWRDILLPAIGTFVAVATIEEGLRYITMRIWLRRSKIVDQVFDGLLLGVSLGLGFATLENTIYFLGLFREGSYDTLVFVFFLRFLISTLAHVSFAGLMGTMIAQGVFNLYTPRRNFVPAFFIPWFLHGLYDLLLGINFGLYAVVMLLPALIIFVVWTNRREFFVLHRREGNLLEQEQAPQTPEIMAVTKLLKTMDTPWNKNAPWLSQSRSYHRILGTLKDEQA